MRHNPLLSAEKTEAEAIAEQEYTQQLNRVYQIFRDHGNFGPFVQLAGKRRSPYRYQFTAPGKTACFRTLDEAEQWARQKLGKARSQRRALDFYPTHRDGGHVDYLLSQLPFKLSGAILEPCCGAGDISDPLRDRGYITITNDIDTSHSADCHQNAALPETWQGWLKEWGKIEWIITNPPFNLASQILPLALEHADKGVIFLLRLSYLEPCENRRDWLRKNSDRMSIILPPKRISFTGDGKTDNVATAWFLWSKSNRLCPPFIFPLSMGQQSLFGHNYLVN